MTEPGKESNELRLNEEIKGFLQNLAEAVRQAVLIRTPAPATVPVYSRHGAEQRSCEARVRLAQQLRSR